MLSFNLDPGLQPSARGSLLASPAIHCFLRPLYHFVHPDHFDHLDHLDRLDNLDLSLYFFCFQHIQPTPVYCSYIGLGQSNYNLIRTPHHKIKMHFLLATLRNKTPLKWREPSSCVWLSMLSNICHDVRSWDPPSRNLTGCAISLEHPSAFQIPLLCPRRKNGFVFSICFLMRMK